MIFVGINEISTLSPSQTTAQLILGLARRGHAVGVFGVDGVSIDPSGQVQLAVRQAATAPSIAAMCAALAQAPEEPRAVSSADAIWLRTNPGRYSRPDVHGAALAILEIAADRGVAVLNHPLGLHRAETKLYLHHLPESVRPPTLVAQRPGQLRAFVEAAAGPVVLKPLMGTRGTDVFRVRAGADNLAQIIDVLCRQGPVMAQGYVPEAVDGDVRVLLVNGAPLKADGAFAAVRRRPPKGDFRSNVFRGGAAERVTEIPGVEAIAAAVAPQLAADGLFFVGLDLIGSKVVEVNVFSPGGLGDAERFGGVDFMTPLLDAFEVAAGLR